jgi:uncharacterized Zn-finger protein
MAFAILPKNVLSAAGYLDLFSPFIDAEIGKSSNSHKSHHQCLDNSRNKNNNSNTTCNAGGCATTNNDDMCDLEKPFRCTYPRCVRSFSSKRNLVDHFKGHHGTKPHVCLYRGCGKSFLRPTHLQIHMRIHTGEKPFVCEHTGCGKRWNQKSALKQHLRSHTGEKPFTCPVTDCYKSFSTSSSCKRHQLTHHHPLHASALPTSTKSELGTTQLFTQDSSNNADQTSKMDEEKSPYWNSCEGLAAAAAAASHKMGLSFLLN